jgi:hypothetical protein
MPPRDIFEDEPKRLLELFKELQSTSDRVAVISATAFLDDSLGVALRARFVPLGNGWADKIFSGSGGPLSTLSSKIVIGYALGLYGPITRKDLDTIRNVRNSFAHTALPLDFSDAEIIEKCDKLTTPERRALDPVFSGFGKSFDISSARGRFIYTTRSLATVLLLYARNSPPYQMDKPMVTPPSPPNEMP